MYEQFKELADVDITAGPMEVGPTTHYAMGGVRVNPDTGAATVPGLFAAGEVTGGMHGANRLGGNSLSDLLVFGQRAGAGAAAHAAHIADVPYVDPVQVREASGELDEPLAAAGGEDPYRLRDELQSTMQSLVGIFRVKEDLDKALRQIIAIRARAGRLCATGPRTFNPGWNLVFELHNMIDVSEAITRSALERTESRGAHSRLDFPSLDPKWGRLNNVVTRDGARMRVTTARVSKIPDELREIIQPVGGA
jgi:succinate dehydrogenase / fumarate reductase flavoprotein subunit